jgi:hypothetical protein
LRCFARQLSPHVVTRTERDLPSERPIHEHSFCTLSAQQSGRRRSGPRQPHSRLALGPRHSLGDSSATADALPYGPSVAVEVHVTGRIELGRFGEFVQAAQTWRAFRRGRGSADCGILQALSGEMNAVRLVFEYPDLNTYEREEARDAADEEYARVAGAMPFVEGTLSYEIYRELDSR